MVKYNITENTSTKETIDFILSTYHIPERKVLQELDVIFNKLNIDYGTSHGEISQATELFCQFIREILKHFTEEEQIIFPAIIKFERLLKEWTLESDFIQDLMFRNTKMVNEHKEFYSYLAAIEELLNSSNLDESKIYWLWVLRKMIRKFNVELHEHAGLEDSILYIEASDLQAQLRKKLEE